MMSIKLALTTLATFIAIAPNVWSVQQPRDEVVIYQIPLSLGVSCGPKPPYSLLGLGGCVGNSICSVVVGQTYDIQLSLAPSRDRQNVSLLLCQVNGNDESIIDSDDGYNLTQGGLIQLLYPWTVDQDFPTGDKQNLRFKVIDDNDTEFCEEFTVIAGKT